jgi:hypothetical protein
MDRTRTVYGNFDEDLATNETPVWWLYHYYPDTNDLDAAAMSDTDNDGFTAWKEYLTDTDPTNAASQLQFVGMASTSTGGVSLTWLSSPARYYSIVCSSNLMKIILGRDYSWTEPPIVNNIPGNAARTNTYLLTPPPDAPRYYRVQLSQ